MRTETCDVTVPGAGGGTGAGGRAAADANPGWGGGAGSNASAGSGAGAGPGVSGGPGAAHPDRTLSRCFALLVCALLIACEAPPEEVQPPIPIPDPTPIAYPEGLWDRGVQGETEVLVHIDEMGDVDSVLVSKTSGFSDFDSAAVNGVRRLRFTPGQHGDRRVAMWTRMPVRFMRDSTATLGTSTGSGVSNP